MMLDEGCWILDGGYLFWLFFDGEMYLVLLINQKDYWHIKKIEVWIWPVSGRLVQYTHKKGPTIM